MSHDPGRKSNPLFLCQLVETLESIQEKESSYKRFQIAFRLVRKRVLKKILWQFEKIGRLFGLAPAAPTEPELRPHPLSLKEGESVRVKNLADIRKTLDAEGRCERMAYIPNVMAPYEDMSFRVHTVVDRFYDEVCERPVKLKNTVLLTGAHCDGSQITDAAGCDRNCLIFWKEAWLERVPEDDSASKLQDGSRVKDMAQESLGNQIEDSNKRQERIGPENSLAPVDQVRVKSLSEIVQTLDEDGKTEDIAFVQEHMAEYCGKEFTIAKAVSEFYDERRRTGLKLNNGFVLNDVFCNGDQPKLNERCKRSCLLFWHSRWLDRVR